MCVFWVGRVQWASGTWVVVKSWQGVMLCTISVAGPLREWCWDYCTWGRADLKFHSSVPGMCFVGLLPLWESEQAVSLADVILQHSLQWSPQQCLTEWEGQWKRHFPFLLEFFPWRKENSEFLWFRLQHNAGQFSKSGRHLNIFAPLVFLPSFRVLEIHILLSITVFRPRLFLEMKMPFIFIYYYYWWYWGLDLGTHTS
jgi:hypothetical protein